jgi:hypothetical protein
MTVAALFICSAACQNGSGAPKGFIVDLATAGVSCGDGRVIVAFAIGRHRVKLNAEPDVSFPEGVQRLREVMTHRAEKVVYVKAEADVSWEEFLELLDDVWPEVSVVSILTPQVEATARRTHCLGLSCRDCTRFGGFHTRNQ